jgi:hypothetical protein
MLYFSHQKKKQTNILSIKNINKFVLLIQGIHQVTKSNLPGPDKIMLVVADSLCGDQRIRIVPT